MRIALLVLLCVVALGCDKLDTALDKAADLATLSSEREVEIAPGQWLTLKKEDTVYASDLQPNRTNPHALTPKEAAKRGLARCIAPIPTLQKKNVEKSGSPCRLKTLKRNNSPRWNMGMPSLSAASFSHCFVYSYSSRSGQLL